MLKNKRKYDVVSAVRVGRNRNDEYIALLPAFNNGYVYARTYADKFIELLDNINDLIKQEEQYLLNRGLALPVVSEVTEESATKYLPYDELEELEEYKEIRVITLYVE